MAVPSTPGRGRGSFVIDRRRGYLPQWYRNHISSYASFDIGTV